MASWLEPLNLFLEQFGVEAKFTVVGGERTEITIVAARRFDAGDIVLSSDPYAYILHPQSNRSRCSHCFVRLPQSGKLRCSACRSVHYCSKSHQKRNWKSHKLECKNYYQVKAKHIPAPVEADLLLACRALRRHSKDRKEGESKEQSSNCPFSFGNLLSHKAEVKKHFPDVMKANIEMERLANNFHLTPNDMTPGDVYETLLKFQCNNFAITNDLIVSEGAGCYPIGAMLNHSCRANCVLTYSISKKGVPRQIIRCTTDLEAGTELTHPYTDLAATTKKRQEKLFTAYLFKCSCEMCCGGNSDIERYFEADVDGAPLVLTASDQKSATLQNASKMHIEADECEDIEKEYKLLKRSLKIRSKYLHGYNLTLLAGTTALLNVCLILEKFKEAEGLSRSVVDIYRKMYDNHHPMLALQLHTLGDLCLNIGKHQEAIAYLREAKRILSITHGTDNVLVNRLVERLGSFMNKYENN